MSNTTPQPSFPNRPQGAPPQPGATAQQPTVPQPTVPYPTLPQPQAAPQQPAPAQVPAYVPAVPQPAPQQSLSTRMGDTNTFAILAIIFAFLAPLAGIIFGHLALGQIKRNGDAGRGIGLTGLVISYAYFAFLAIFIFAYIGFLVMIFGTMGAAMSELGSYDSSYSY